MSRIRCRSGALLEGPLSSRPAMALATVFAIALGASACGSNTLGTLGQVLGSAVGGQPGSSSGSIAAQVQRVNTQQRTIQVVTTDGQSGSVYYDQNTAVVYQNQQYPVTSLEQG